MLFSLKEYFPNPDDRVESLPDDIDDIEDMEDCIPENIP